MQVTSYEAMRTMVQANVGGAVIPEPNLLPYKDLLGLCCIPLVGRWASMQLNLVLPEDEPAPAVRHLVSFLTAPLPPSPAAMPDVPKDQLPPSRVARTLGA